MLMRSLILRRLLRRHVLQADEQHVGILVPPSSGGVVTNLAVSFDRRVAINLNYTVSADVMNECIELASIRHVLTSRKIMEKLDLQINAELIYLEDLKPHVTLADKLVSALAAYVLPAGWLARSLNLWQTRADDVLTIIFTSGSTGIPKGVMLTHANVRSNVDAVNQVIHLQRADTIVGILPVALCRMLGLAPLRYAVRAYALPLALAAGFAGIEFAFPFSAACSAGIALYAFIAIVVVGLATWWFGFEPHHRRRLAASLTRRRDSLPR